MKRVAFILAVSVFFLLPFSSFGGVSSYKDLFKCLKDMKGWNAEKPYGMTMDTPGGKSIMAMRRYVKGDRSFEAAILVGMYAYSALQSGFMGAPYSKGVTIDTPEGFFRTMEHKGFTIWVGFSKSEKSGVVAAQLVDGNFPALFMINFNGMDYKEAIGLLDRFDLKGLASSLK